jgi:calcineurin-like phosphoesterase family protein
MRRVQAALLLAVFWIVAIASLAAIELRLPNKDGSVKFAVIGDTGTGGKPQYEIGALMAGYRTKFPFDFVVMVGDNLYGSERPQDFQKKFELPYKTLLDAGVKFYAALGNHDDPNQRYYKPFNMGDERYYKYSKGPVEFFVLDSTYIEPKQLAWLEQQLQNSRASWKVAYFHHPLYSSGDKHGSDMDLRVLLEPLFLKYGVNLVLAGHEHFYERLKPQKGIYYFTCGGSAKLRKGNIKRGEMTAEGLDTENTFMLFEIEGDQIHFQTVSRVDKIVDAGVLPKQKFEKATAAK